MDEWEQKIIIIIKNKMLPWGVCRCGTRKSLAADRASREKKNESSKNDEWISRDDATFMRSIWHSRGKEGRTNEHWNRTFKQCPNERQRRRRRTMASKNHNLTNRHREKFRKKREMSARIKWRHGPFQLKLGWRWSVVLYVNVTLCYTPAACA